MSSVRVLSRAVLPAAIVFDCDGLLLDTEGCWSVGETALFARHGLAFGDDHKQALIGVAMPDAGPILEELLASPGRGAELTRARRDGRGRGDECRVRTHAGRA